ncbi:MAG: sulfatase [bacterium]|nr:sulfatase [bacterium]
MAERRNDNENQAGSAGARALTRREFIGGALAAGALGALGAGGCAPLGRWGGARAGRRPNLLFVFDDQHAWDMLGCYGNGQVQTPNLDRLATEGVRFNRCISNACVCTPYRGILMSGQHPLYNGCLLNDLRMLSSAERGGAKTFGEALRDAGYHTGYIGKWHILGGDRNRNVPRGPYRYGFDEVFFTNNCTTDFRPGHCYYWNEKNEKVFFQEWEPYGQARQAMEFIDGCDDDRPFALFVSWHPPHDHEPTRRQPDPRGIRYDIYDAPDDLMALYDPAKIRLRPSVPDAPERRLQYQGYMAQCTGIDRAFGWLMDKLREKGFERNTVVVFTADHGDMLGSCGRPWPKCYPEDASTRVPLIIRAPDLAAGRASDLLVSTLDLMPTLLGLLGVSVPETCQGADLAAAIRRGREDAIESVPLFMPQSNWRGIYTPDYTYSFDIDPAGEYNRLYDHRKDPDQLRNCFGAPEYRAVQERLHQMTLAWMERFGDRLIDIRKVLEICTVEGPHNYDKKGMSGALRGRPVDLLKGIQGVV